MTWTIANAAAYFSGTKAPRSFLTFIRQVKCVLTFSHERANRLVRYDQIVEDYKAGRPVADIEREYGCTKGTVLRYARIAGLPKRPKGFTSDVRRGVILEYQNNKPIAEIAVRFGVSQAYVSKTAAEEGISRYRNIK